MHIFTVLCTATCVVALPRVRASLDPLLTTISKSPDLSIFYSLFNGTGGNSGKPGPDFEERFNIPASSLQFTFFAPTNEASALARLPPGLVSALAEPRSYELIKSALLTHVTSGSLSDSELENGATIETIEGFRAIFDRDGDITTGNSHSGNETPPAQARLVRNSSGKLDCIEASNGRICKIDGFLDGYLTYLGEDAAYESSSLPPVKTVQGTMRDIVDGNSELQSLQSVVKRVDPSLLNRLSLFSKDEAAHQSTIYMAPSNAAFDSLPADSYARLIQPSNNGLSRLLLRAGFGQMDKKSPVLHNGQGFDVTIKGSQAMNARITSRTCAENGCVWVISRLLDPLSTFGTS